MNKQEQKLYDKGWREFVGEAKDGTPKSMSDLEFGTEFGAKLRELANDPLALACLETAYAYGWVATCPVRTKEANP